MNGTEHPADKSQITVKVMITNHNDNNMSIMNLHCQYLCDGFH